MNLMHYTALNKMGNVVNFIL